MNIREKAKQFVADRYLSSPEGVREVQQLQEYFEKENAMIDIGVQIMNLLPASSKPDSLWMRAQHIALHLAELFDLTPKQKDSLAAAIEMDTKSDTRADLPYDDDLPF